MTTGSTAVVYGLDPLGNSFCLGDFQSLTTWRTELLAIKACGTYGQLLRLAPTLTRAWIPFDVAERVDEQDLEDDSPWSWQREVADSDGDWPPSPLGAALDELGDDESLWRDLLAIEGVEIIATTLNGDQLIIPECCEQSLLSALSAHGISAIRDDLLFEAFA
jgi:hypothetical protein